MKRVTIIVAFINLNFYFYYKKKKNYKNKKKVAIFLILISFCLCYVYVENMISSSVYFEQRVNDTMDGNSSSRSDLYGNFWNMFWNNSDPVSFVFGYGADSTIRYGKNYAHNDWLEIAINQGVLGIIVFSIFWKRLFSFWLSTKKIPILYVSVGVCFIQLFSKALFSMSITDMQIYVSMVLGYAVVVKNYPNLESNLYID